MLLDEFIDRTGVFPSAELYHQIELAYYASNMDKNAFCAAYKANKDGMAEKIALDANMAEHDRERQDEEKQEAHEEELDALKKQILQLERELEREQEWKPYQCPDNVSEEQYHEIVCLDAQIMTDDEVREYIAAEFGFAPDAVEVLHSVPLEEKNRHGCIRSTGETYARRPLWVSSDANYVRFDVRGWSYECLNGNLRKFY